LHSKLKQKHHNINDLDLPFWFFENQKVQERNTVMSARSGGRKKRKEQGGGKVIADNRKARFNYEIIETFEAGMALQGTEVKALRDSGANIRESYVSPENSELFLVNAHIDEYTHGNRNNHLPRRPRKLLLKRREIDKLSQRVQRDGLTIVPLKLYFNDRGRAKLAIGLAKGKKLHDKRETEKKRDWAKQKARVMKDYN
jgi:SsrA-binding protein